MNTRAKASHAPALLCHLLSPYTSKSEAKKTLDTLLNDEELLDLCIELANRHFLIPTLYTQLSMHELLTEVPGELTEFMHEMTDFMHNRNQSLTELSEEIIILCNRQGITPLLIKGASVLFSDIYPDKGIRFMSDLDLVFKEEEAIKVFHLLQSEGFHIPENLTPSAPIPYLQPNCAIEDLPKGQHLLPIYRQGDPCWIEIHHRPVSNFFYSYLHNKQAHQSASTIETLEEKGLYALHMNPSNELIHCFVHSELAHRNHANKILDIRQMDYFVRLAHHYNKTVDWDEIHSRIQQGGDEDIFQHYLYTLNQLFGAEFPINFKKLDTKILEKRYKKSIGSCFPRYWKAAQLVALIKEIYSKKSLYNRYETHTPLLLFKARLANSARLVKKFHNPIKLLERLQSLIKQ